LIRKPVSSQLN